jgi:beta-phosphoglucomutase-like phosphatase (HAD superfamily)
VSQFDKFKHKAVAARAEAVKGNQIGKALLALSETPDGETFLAWLRAQAFGRAVDHGGSSAELWQLEGVRGLVLRVEQQIFDQAVMRGQEPQ